MIIAASTYAADTETLIGRKGDIKNWVPASVVDIKIGPEMPAEIFIGMADEIKKNYAAAQYRLVFTTAEIYYILSVDLLGVWEEGDRDLLETYFLPLYGYIDMVFVQWNSYNNFDLILETLNVKTKMTKMNITIKPDGKFEILKKVMR